MTAIGFIDGQTKVYATHFNPHQGLTHFQIQDFFNSTAFKVTVAYDCMKVVV